MTTLAIMKARIATELGDRTDLTSEIAAAITSAISEYQQRRFWFNESRDTTFPTVAGQEFYSSSDSAAIPDLYRIDYVSVLIGSTVSHLRRATEADLDGLSQNGTASGDPTDYSYFAKKFRFYPVPNAVRTIRVGGHIKFAAPATDAEASNVWMTDAEKLIRSRAKYELAIHQLHDPDLAALMTAAVTEQVTSLSVRTGRQVGRGRVRATQF